MTSERGSTTPTERRSRRGDRRRRRVRRRRRRLRPDRLRRARPRLRRPAVVGATVERRGAGGAPVRRRATRAFGSGSSAGRRDGTFTRYGYPRYLPPGAGGAGRRGDGGLPDERPAGGGARVGFDEALPSLSGYALAEDEDFSLRLSRLGRIRYLPEARVVHRKQGFGSRGPACVQQAGRREPLLPLPQELSADARWPGRSSGSFCSCSSATGSLNRDWAGARGLLEGVREAGSAGDDAGAGRVRLLARLARRRRALPRAAARRRSSRDVDQRRRLPGGRPARRARCRATAIRPRSLPTSPRAPGILRLGLAAPAPPGAHEAGGRARERGQGGARRRSRDDRDADAGGLGEARLQLGRPARAPARPPVRAGGRRERGRAADLRRSHGRRAKRRAQRAAAESRSTARQGGAASGRRSLPDSGTVVVLLVGRFDPHKGQRELLAIAPELAAVSIRAFASRWSARQSPPHLEYARSLRQEVRAPRVGAERARSSGYRDDAASPDRRLGPRSHPQSARRDWGRA